MLEDEPQKGKLHNFRNVDDKLVAAKAEVERLEEVARKAKEFGEDLKHSMLEVKTREIQLGEDKSQSSDSLPEFCETWNKTDAESCIDKCYELEVARESGQATEEMWWDVGSSLFDGVGQLAGLAKGLIQERQELSAKREEKFVLTAIAGIGIVGSVVGGIGKAFVEEEHAQENLNAQHCEQLSAVLMSRKLVEIEKNQDRMLGRIDKSIQMIAQVNQNLFKIEDSVKRMEEKLTQKLDKLHQNHLDTLTTTFLQCVGTIQHEHAAAQGIMSDYLSIKESFRSITQTGDEIEKMANGWLASMTKWKQDLPGRVDPIATSALDGLRCISSLLSHSDLLRGYLKDQLKSHMKATAQEEGWVTSRDIMDYFLKMQLDTIEGMLRDDFLPLLHASVTQTRFILALAPRPGYWESFSLYLQTMKEVLSKFLVSGELYRFSKEAIRDVLDENTAQMFPVRASCLDALAALPNVDTLKMTVWDDTEGDLIIAESLTSMIVDSDKVDTQQGNFFHCFKNGTAGRQGWYYKDRLVTGTEGYNMRKNPESPKEERMRIEQSWHCAARFFNQKSAAAEEYFSCLRTEGKTSLSCEPQLALTCPAEIVGAEFRCRLPGCSHAKLDDTHYLPCANINGSIMIFKPEGEKVEAKCQEACLRLRSCGAVLYQKRDNLCTLFPPGHDCKFEMNAGFGGEFGASVYNEIIDPVPISKGQS